jgi:hypothetical protein
MERVTSVPDEFIEEWLGITKPDVEAANAISTMNGDIHVRKDEHSIWNDRHGSSAGRGDARDDLGYRRRLSRRARGAHAVPASNHKGSEVIHRFTIGIAVPLLGVTAFMVARLTVSAVLVGYWIFGAVLIAICLLAFVRGRKFVNFPIARGRTIAVIPAYNEPQDKLYACVRSLMVQR